MPARRRSRASSARRSIFSTSWQNDQTPQAMGHYMNQKDVKTAFLIGPELCRRQGHARRRGRHVQGKIVGEELTKWPDQLDFSAELAKAKAAKPDAIFVFYPGSGGRAVPEPVRAGRPQGQIPLYTAFTIDELSLPLQKDLALGVPGAQQVGERPAE